MQPCGFPDFHSVLVDGITAEIATPLSDVKYGDFAENEPYLSGLLLHGLNHLAAAFFRLDYNHDVIDESRIVMEFEMFETELVKSCQVVVADALAEIRPDADTSRASAHVTHDHLFEEPDGCFSFIVAPHHFHQALAIDARVELSHVQLHDIPITTLEKVAAYLLAGLERATLSDAAECSANEMLFKTKRLGQTPMDDAVFNGIVGNDPPLSFCEEVELTASRRLPCSGKQLR